MFGKKFFVIFPLMTLLISLIYADWPEDGWQGVPNLHISYRGTVLNFDEVHQLLATEEEKVARVLPSNNPTNVVLASISFVGNGTPSPYTYHLRSPESKWFVFESGWASSFTSNPVYEEAQKLMRPYAPKLQKEDGLTPSYKDQLVQDCIKVARSQCYFEEHVRPHFLFFEQDPVPVEYILERAERVFSQINPSDPGYNVYEGLIKDKRAFNRVTTTLQTTQIEAAQSISGLSAKIDTSVGVNLEFIKELAANAKSIQEKLSKNGKELSNIGSKVIATYWHSEQKFLKFIEDEMQGILDDLFKKSLPFTPEAVFINIHSRHDICSVCSHTLVHSYTQPEGILNTLRNALCERLEVKPQNFPLYITSSFREKREKTIYNVKAEQPMSIEDIHPAFPTLYIPISLQ